MKGSFQKRPGRGGKTTWTCVVDLPRGVDGRRKQARLSAPTRKELEQKVAETLTSIHKGTFVQPSKLTVADYFPKWLAAIEGTVRPSSYRVYAGVVRLHVVPDLGAVPLAKLTALDVHGFCARKREAGLGASRVRTIHAVVGRALRQAVAWQLVPRNVAAGAELPAAEAPELRVWTAEQVRAFLAYLDGLEDKPLDSGHRFAAMWRLALFTGMRPGELLALRWEDVDLDRAVLRVTRTLTRRADGAYAFGPPKTKAGTRSIALPPSCVAALRRHRDRQTFRRAALGEAWHDLGLVFDRGDGRDVNPAAHHAALAKAVARAGLPPISGHGLRHTHATLALANTHPKVVQERLGHKTIAETLDRYSHLTENMQREAAARFEADLLPPAEAGPPPPADDAELAG